MSIILNFSIILIIIVSIVSILGFLYSPKKFIAGLILFVLFMSLMHSRIFPIIFMVLIGLLCLFIYAKTKFRKRKTN